MGQFQIMKPIKFKRYRRRIGSRREHIGRVRWKLFNMLQEAGFSINSPDELWMQEGAYRNRFWDLARWGADWKNDEGIHYIIYSWDTMTDCVRFGFTFVEETHNQNIQGIRCSNHFEIYGKKT